MYIVQEVVPKYSHFINNIQTMAEGMTDEELIDIADKYKRMRLSRSDSQTFEDINHRYTQGSLVAICITIRLVTFDPDSFTLPL